MECPKCGSQDTHRSAVSLTRGSNESSTATIAAGAAGHDVAHRELTGARPTQPRLAKNAGSSFRFFSGARGILMALILAYVVLRVLARAAGFDSLGLFGPMMIILILGTAVWLFISYPRRAAARAAWSEQEESWVCSRCGTRFVP